MKHTTGLWKLDNRAENTVRIEIMDGYFAMAYAGTEANARLIAAAPMLLSELQQAMVELQEAAELLEGRGFPSLSGLYREAAINKQAAIKKATQ